jgi:hypothetical protein
MCLYKDKKHHPFNKPLIAEEDIVCYKALVHSDTYPPDILHTPFQLEPIRISVYLDCQIPFFARDENKFLSFLQHKLGFSERVGSGFIHTYRDAFTACISQVSIFKCIIPAGTEYFIGTGNDYASKKIIFLEKVT